MFKYATLALLACASAAPAQFLETPTVIRVPVAGKSAEQISIELASAARQVCLADASESRFAFRQCLRATLADAKAQVRQG